MAVDTLLQMEFNPKPIPCAATIMTIEMPPIIRAYSIIVAPDWSRKRLEKNDRIVIIQIHNSCECCTFLTAHR
jgi:hypothetical protein